MYKDEELLFIKAKLNIDKEEDMKNAHILFPATKNDQP